jgi:hypothetical protein
VDTCAKLKILVEPLPTYLDEICALIRSLLSICHLLPDALRTLFLGKIKSISSPKNVIQKRLYLA